MSTTTTIWSVSMRPKSIESGASQMARNSSPTCTMISETELRIPPAATADAEVEAVLLEEPHLHRGVGRDRDREVRERHRRLQLDARPHREADRARCRGT